jgi:hypothetical protein
MLVAVRLGAVTLEPPFNFVHTLDARTRDGMGAILTGVARKIGPGSPAPAPAEPAEAQPVAPKRIVTPAATVGGVKFPRMALEIGPTAGKPPVVAVQAPEGKSLDTRRRADARPQVEGARIGLPHWLVPAGLVGFNRNGRTPSNRGEETGLRPAWTLYAPCQQSPPSTASSL